MKHKQVDEKYCSECGAIIKAKAQICLKCGVAQEETAITKPKSRTTAILLAVFLSFWTWLYTYKQDSWKFWVALGVNLLLWWTLVIPIGIWIWAIVDQCRKKNLF